MNVKEEGFTTEKGRSHFTKECRKTLANANYQQVHSVSEMLASVKITDHTN